MDKIKDGPGKEAFDSAAMDLLGPAALTGGTLSLMEVARHFWNAAIATAAERCHKQAMVCGQKADHTDDQDDEIELKARAWQMEVMSAEINGFAVPDAQPKTGGEK